ncbi:MAG: SRPBCC family protein [Gemmatimonadaceae bacterium]|nr:SRPBCC family protein [Gemmatimonadaceae bacterium]
MHWHAEHSLETAASAAAIWNLLCNVTTWPEWNAGVARIALDGPFVVGTWFTMTTAEQESLRSQLIEVTERRSFTDETRVGDLVVTVAHRIETSVASATRIVYRIDAIGPGADQIGSAIASDFPEVLTSLAAAALTATALAGAR